jgi:IPT/TIG domain
MTTLETGHAGPSGILSPRCTTQGREVRRRRECVRNKIRFLTAALFLAPLVFAQGTAKITGVNPSSGKVGDSVTITGEGLGKGSVAAVFLSDDKSDYKATIMDQAADKIVMKVPDVKPGGYNVSIQVGTGILIEPVRLTVQ